MDKKIFSILNSNPLRNISLLGFFSNYPVVEYFIEGNSVLILGRGDHLWAYISSSSAEELSILLDRHHMKTKYYSSVEDWMIPIILRHGVAEWNMSTNRFILKENVLVETPSSEIVEVDRSCSAFMYNNSDYKEYISIEYIEDRLSKDISAGIMKDDILVAWGFTHDDGALGFLHVLEDYRKKGLGIDILLTLIQMRRKADKPIFCNITQENTVSNNLARKLGFTLDRKASWIKLK